MSAPNFILNTGKAMPAVGFGTWGIPNDAIPSSIRSAIRVGYRLLDLAPVYGSEAAVGGILSQLQQEGQHQRSDLFLTSKVPPTGCSREGVIQTCEDTLRKLGVSYLDLYLVHVRAACHREPLLADASGHAHAVLIRWFGFLIRHFMPPQWPFCVKPGSPTWPPPQEYMLGYSPEQLRETWRAMEQLYAAGKVRAIGLSNIGLNRLKKLLAAADLVVKPAVIQIEFHPYLQSASLVRFCLANGIRVTAYSSLGSAMRPAKYQAAGDPTLLQDPVILQVAAETSASPAAVALAWAVSKGVAVIPKSATPSRIVDNFAATTLSLSAAHLAAIDGLERGHRFLTQGWYGYAWKPEQTLAQLLDDPPAWSDTLGEPRTLIFLAMLLAGACYCWPRRHTY